KIRALAGRTHELCSSVVVARNGARIWHHADRGLLTMRAMDEPFVDAYLARTGEAVCASVGAYQLEGLGVHLFSKIEGDYFTVLGLPLLPLLAFLSDPCIGLEKAAVRPTISCSPKRTAGPSPASSAGGSSIRARRRCPASG